MIDEYTGKPYNVDVAHVLAARTLWERYRDTNGSSERAFIAVIAPVLAAQAARPEEQRKWIPMKERQPADFERVLCVNSIGYMATANRFHDTRLGSWNGSDYTAEEQQELVIGDITHWMPLPEAPRSPQREPK